MRSTVGDIDADTVTTIGEAAPRLRADARRNRDRIIAAARELFVEYGAEAPFDEVARRAGVGNATLYRHFADRRELAHRVALSVMERVVAAGELAAAEEPDAYEALRRFAHGAVDERIGALCTLLSADVDNGHPELVAARARLGSLVESLMVRSRASGRLRDDVGAGDVLMAITQLTRPLPGLGCTVNDRHVHRHLDVLLDGFGATNATPLAGEPLSLNDLDTLTSAGKDSRCRK